MRLLSINAKILDLTPQVPPGGNRGVWERILHSNCRDGIRSSGPWKTVSPTDKGFQSPGICYLSFLAIREKRSNGGRWRHSERDVYEPGIAELPDGAVSC